MFAEDFVADIDPRIITSKAYSGYTYSEVRISRASAGKDDHLLNAWVCKRTVLPLRPIIEKIITGVAPYWCIASCDLGVMLAKDRALRMRFIERLRIRGELSSFQVVEYIGAHTTQSPPVYCSVLDAEQMIADFREAHANVSCVILSIIDQFKWSADTCGVITRLLPGCLLDEDVIAVLCERIPLSGLRQLEDTKIIYPTSWRLTRQILSAITDNPEQEDIFKWLFAHTLPILQTAPPGTHISLTHAGDAKFLDRSALNGMFGQINQSLLSWLKCTMFAGKSLFEYAIEYDIDCKHETSMVLDTCLSSVDHKTAIDLLEQLQSRVPVSSKLLARLSCSIPADLFARAVDIIEKFPRAKSSSDTTYTVIRHLIRHGDAKMADRIWSWGICEHMDHMILTPFEYGGEHMITALNWSRSKGARLKYPLYGSCCMKFANFEASVKWLIDNDYDVRNNRLEAGDDLFVLNDLTMGMIATIRKLCEPMTPRIE